MTATSARLDRVEIRDYRNLARIELTFPEAGIVLVGDNGQGKTNLLEAIYYFQLLRSMRGARDTDVVRFGAEGFLLRGSVGHPGPTEVAVGFDRASKRKRVQMDGTPVTRLSDALGLLPTVMVSPADSMLAGGEPSARRRFLDVLLALTSRSYLTALQKYRAALHHRNSAIRAIQQGRGNEDSVAVWEPALASSGAVLARERREWARWGGDRFRELCTAIGERGSTGLRYGGPLADVDDPESTLASLLEARRASDIRRGATHTGPHRDSLMLSLEGRDLRGVGSSGQQRTAAVALRLLEAETYQQRTGAAPVFLMDDPFAELDAKRGEAIVSVLRSAAVGQIFLAVPKTSDIPAGFSELSLARVEAGAISMMSR